MSTHYLSEPFGINLTHHPRPLDEVQELLSEINNLPLEDESQLLELQEPFIEALELQKIADENIYNAFSLFTNTKYLKNILAYALGEMLITDFADYSDNEKVDTIIIDHFETEESNKIVFKIESTQQLDLEDLHQIRLELDGQMSDGWGENGSPVTGFNLQGLLLKHNQNNREDLKILKRAGFSPLLQTNSIPARFSLWKEIDESPEIKNKKKFEETSAYRDILIDSTVIDIQLTF